MSREQNVDSPQPDDEPQPPPTRPHDPIKPDPMNPKSLPSHPSNEAHSGELPKEDWGWAEHED